MLELIHDGLRPRLEEVIQVELDRRLDHRIELRREGPLTHSTIERGWRENALWKQGKIVRAERGGPARAGAVARGDGKGARASNDMAASGPGVFTPLRIGRRTSSTVRSPDLSASNM